jgi:subtilisin family serine protease
VDEDVICENGGKCVAGKCEKNNPETQITNNNLPKYVPGEVLIKFKENSGISDEQGAKNYLNSLRDLNLPIIKDSQKLINSQVKSMRGQTKSDSIGLDRIYKIKFDKDKDVLNAVNKYKSYGEIEYAEPNYISYTTNSLNDPLYQYQWPLKNTGQAYFSPSSKFGAIYKSPGNFLPWSEISTGLPNLYFTPIVSYNNYFYVGASIVIEDHKNSWGIGNTNNSNAGIYRSSDGGLTWQKFALKNISVLDLTINSFGEFFAATGNGLYKSTDYGITWVKLTVADYNTYIGDIFSQIKYDYVNQSIMYTVVEDMLNTKQFHYLYRSTNRGSTWTKILFTGGFGLITDFEIDFPDNSNIYVSTISGGIFKTNNSGVTWKRINNGLNEDFAHRVDIYDLEIHNSQEIYAGGEYGLYKSIDGGENWIKDDYLSYRSVESVLTSGEDIYIGLLRFNYDKLISNVVCNYTPSRFPENYSVLKRLTNGEWYPMANGLLYNAIALNMKKIPDLLNSPYYATLDQSLTEKLVSLNGSSGSDMNVENVWNLPIKKNPIIAVIDTGVDYNHEDLATNIWNNSDEIPNNGIDDDGNGYIDDVRGYDFVDTDTYYWEHSYCVNLSEEDYSNKDNNPSDIHGHGTHCAGIIAATQQNGKGISGVCPGCKIMPVRAGYSISLDDNLGKAGALDLDSIVQSIYYAANNGADVISMSFGGGESQSEKNALDYAYSQGVVLVAAAGNDNSYTMGYPAAYENVIAVAATDANDKKALFSNYGDWVDIAAPGKDILSLRAEGSDMYGTKGRIVQDKYYVASGTSMATPYVAGAVGLLISKLGNKPNNLLYNAVINNSDNITLEVHIGGRINVGKAFNSLNYLCGDADSSGSVDISDAVYLINYIFSHGPAPNPLLAADANNDGSIDISDAVYLVNYIFSGGAAPCQVPANYVKSNIQTKEQVTDYMKNAAASSKKSAVAA